MWLPSVAFEMTTRRRLADDNGEGTVSFSPDKKRSRPKRASRTLGTGEGTGCGDADGLNVDAEELRLRWGIQRTYTGKDSWTLARTTIQTAGGGLLENRDVDHTGCCKAYSVVALSDDTLGQLVYHTGSAGIAHSSASGAKKKKQKNSSLRLQLDVHVRSVRHAISSALTSEEFELLKSKGNANRSGYTSAVSLEDAKLRLALSYDAGLAAGYSMSPVWLEEWEMSVWCRRGWQFSSADRATPFVVVEIHNASASNSYQSHFQVVLPSPSHSLSPNDVVLVVRRMQCHYNPVWLDGKGRHHLGDLPRAFTDFFFPGYSGGRSPKGHAKGPR